MRDWFSNLCALLSDGPVVMVTVLGTTGSAPREPGARMLVHRRGVEGSIGGGQLEFQETAAAHALLAQPKSCVWHREINRVVLGPDAGQCCGGSVEILHELFNASERTAIIGVGDRFARSVKTGIPPLSGRSSIRQPAFQVSHETGDRIVDDATMEQRDALTLYGAGHVARALVPILVTLPIDVSWVDIQCERFPAELPAGARLIVDDPARFAAESEPHGIQLVMTHSHELDYAICDALLRRNDFAFLGLIGSKTNRARFVQRFRRSGVADLTLERLTCPIGDPRITGKAPAVIAIAVAAQLLQFLQDRKCAGLG